MYKLNCLQHMKLPSLNISNNYCMSALVSNEEFDNLCLSYYDKCKYQSLKTFSFTKEGFLGIFLELKGKIAVSVGETQALVDGAKLYEKLGLQIQWVRLNKDGTVNLSDLKNKNIDFLFLSSYVMDTFVKIDLENIKKYTKAKIISNGTAQIDNKADAIYFDNYKLNGINISGVMLFDDNMFELLAIGQIDPIALKICYEALFVRTFNHDVKNMFLEELKEVFDEDLFLFVDPSITLDYSLHFGLRDIKARELIRTMALSKIYITNGEGCSLGLSKPSRIIQSMGYDEQTSRGAISLSFNTNFKKEDVQKIVKTLYLKYKQIQMLS